MTLNWMAIKIKVELKNDRIFKKDCRQFRDFFMYDAYCSPRFPCIGIDSLLRGGSWQFSYVLYVGNFTSFPNVVNVFLISVFEFALS